MGKQPALLIDATPLDSEHRYRGIGTYTRSLIAALQQIEAPAFRTLRLWGAEGDSNALTIWRPAYPSARLQSLLNQVLLPVELYRSRAKVYHATDPERNVHIAGVYRIATLYDLIPLAFASHYLEPLKPQHRALYFQMLLRLESSNQIIAISEFSKAEFVRLRGYDPTRISVVPLGYDATIFNISPDLERSTVFRAQHGNFLVYSGSLEPHKNLPVVLEAMQLLPKNINFVITGKVTQTGLEALSAATRRAGLGERVRHLGFVPKETLPHLYHASLAFVFPSLLEGFGLPLLDAMACGTPVIAAFASSLPEVGGDAPLYFNPEDPADLAHQVTQLLEKPSLRATIAQLGRRQVAHFSWTRAAHATAQIYHQALALV